MKGISPLIAAVLLIAFTVSIATIIIGWFTEFVKTTTTNVSSSIEETIGCSAASISIEYVYLNSSGPGIVIVENTGFKKFTTVSVLVVSNTGLTCNGSTSNLDKGDVASITLSGCTFNCSDFDRAIVTTECGGISDTVTDSSYCKSIG